MNQNAIKYIEHYGYSLSDQIGKGYSSKVYKGWDEQTQINVAIKVIEKAGLKTPLHTQLLISEIDAMKTLDSPYIMKLYNVYQTANNTYLILEFCEGGDLGQRIKQKGKFSESQVQEIIFNLVNAYACLEKNAVGILHRDIKPANILMNKAGQAKLADFGFAKTPQSKPLQANVNIGSPLYMSPEALRKNRYSDKSDIWAIGVSAYELLYGQVPWQARSEKELGQKMVNQRINFNGCSEECRDFIQACLVVNENERATIQYLLNHTWIKKKQQVTQMVKGKGIDKNVLVGYNHQKKKQYQCLKGGKENADTREHHSQKSMIDTHEEDVALLSQVNLCRYLYKIGQLMNRVDGLGDEQRDKMGFLIGKGLMIKMSTLMEMKSGNNVCKLNNYEEYACSQSFWKISQAIESYQLKYKGYFQEVFEKVQGLEDKKLDALLDKNFKEYESFYIILQSFLKQSIKALQYKLEEQLSEYDSEEELEDDDQNSVVLLDYMVTWYQLNKLIIETQNDVYLFAQNSKIDQIAEGEPVQLLFGHFQQIVKKINILSII